MTDADSAPPPHVPLPAAVADVPASGGDVGPVTGLVSVVMPMRNGERYVEPALRSILAQPNVDLEVVVVDDGSTDHSPDVVRGIGDARIRMVPGPRSGIAAALNAGLAAARGAFFARCDADDLYAPDRLAHQLAVLRSRPQFGAVAGSFTYVNASGREIAAQAWSESAEEITHELQNGKGRTHLCTFLIRMEHVRRLEGFRSYFVGTEDADFQLRLGEVCRVWWEPRPAYVYRLHGESITHTQPSAERKFLERMAQEFQKQRRETGRDDLQRGTPPPVPQGLKADARQTNKQIQSILLGEAWRAHHAGRRLRAISTGFRACLASPVELGAWKSLAALAVKPKRCQPTQAAQPARADSAPGR